MKGTTEGYSDVTFKHCGHLSLHTHLQFGRYIDKLTCEMLWDTYFRFFKFSNTMGQVVFDIIIEVPHPPANHPPRCSVSSSLKRDAISAWTSSHVHRVTGSLSDKHFQTVHVCTQNDPWCAKAS